MIPAFLDRPLLPLRLARARARGSYVPGDTLGAPFLVEGHDLAFPFGEASYNSLGRASDGTILFAIGTKTLEAGARLFAANPATSAVRVIADLDRVLSGRDGAQIPQGKVHADFSPVGDALIGATHIGYYDPLATLEQPGTAPGYAPYPGGWFFSIRGDAIAGLKQAPAGEGIITMSVDRDRGLAFALTWPRGLFLTLDLHTLELRNHGPQFAAGELGAKSDGTWMRICRSIGVDPRSGHAYWCDNDGRIVRYDGTSMDAIASTPHREMWRKVLWHPGEEVFYGITWKSSILFRFDPADGTAIEIGTLSASAAPATLALALSPDDGSLHALVTGPAVTRPKKIQLASTVVHMTFDLASGATTKSGPLVLADGRWITQSQSLLFDRGSAYSLCWVEVPRHDPEEKHEAVRRARRHTREYRTRGYAEAMLLVRFPLR